MIEPEFVNADVLKWAAEYEGEPFHALLSDPPYHLTSIVKRFGSEASAPAQEGKDGAFRRASAGFMGQQWDGGEIAFQPETWAAISRHLYPGAFMFCFAGSRGWHRQAVAMEDAGLIMHPSVFAYAFGSGFPKATRILAGEYKDGETIKRTGKEAAVYGSFAGNHPTRIPASEAAKAFSGHRYGAQAMKPAVEPILLFQKPYKGRPLDCITQTGAGALNIDLARIGIQGESPTAKRRKAGFTPNLEKARDSEAQGRIKDRTDPDKKASRHPEDDLGRWPANLVMDESGAASLGSQTGVLTSGQPAGVKQAGNAIYGQYGKGIPVTGFGDSGGASRFFFTYDWNAEAEERLDDAEPLFYCAKAGGEERNAGLDGMPLALSGSLEGGPDRLGGQVREQMQHRANNHPTVKPLRLCRWLASLLLPPDAFTPRRLLVPFSGSGSESIAAMLAGWEHVTGIEQSAEYIKIARTRARFWACNSGLFEQMTQADDDPQQALFTE